MFPASFRDMHGGVPVYFEAAAVITTLCCLARCWSCAHASALLGNSRTAESGASASPSHRRRCSEMDIPLSESGSVAIACASARANAFRGRHDVEGASAVDESMVTGEPMPVTSLSATKSSAAR